MKTSLDVNLLPSKSRLQLKQLQIIKRVNLGMGISLFVFSLLALIILALDFFSRAQVKKSTQELESAKAQFFQLSERIDGLQQLRFRTKLVSQILEGRWLFAPDLKRLEALLGEKVVLTSLQEKEGLISVQGTLSDLSALQDLEEKIKKEDYEKIVLRNLGVNSEGKIGFYLEVVFKKKLAKGGS